MSTIVYHQQGNLQSCFEPQIFEMTATLRLKVPPSPPPCQEVKDLGGWSMLQSLSGIISKDAAGEKEAAYVHPLAPRPSSSRLSEKSLALCTEPLGSETGTDMTESSIFLALASPEPTSRQEESLPPLLPLSQQIESRNVTSAATAAAYRSMNKNSTRNSRNNNFPPPLTTISSGANSLRVRPHREGGRLIIMAVETPSKRTYLQAERSNGRLRLSFFNADLADNQNFDPQITTSDESDGEKFKEESDELEGNINGEDEVAEVQELEEDEEEEEEEKESDVYMARDMDGNTPNVEEEMGITKCLLGRCKETGGHSNKGLSQWGEPKTLWVST